MIRTAGISALLAVAAFAAAAETATVRSGEHGTHSRLVIEPGEPTPWALGRTDTGYELRFDRAGIDFDTARVFTLIPRTRLSEVAQAGDSRLALRVPEGFHARAFETGRGVVIDLYPGPAPDGSPHEAPLPDAVTGTTEPAQPAEVAAPAAGPAPAGATRPRQRPPVVVALASAAAAVLNANPVLIPPIAGPAADPAPEPAPVPAPVPVAEPVAAAEPEPAPQPAPQPAPAPVTLVQPFRTTPEADPRLDLYWSALLSPKPEDPAAEARTPDPAPRAATPVAAASSPATAPAPATTPTPAPDPLSALLNPRVAEAETELLRQLSRAAAQGLVRAEVPEMRPTPAELPRPAPTDAAPEPVEPGRPRSLADHLNVHSRTSIDRELAAVAGGLPLTADGRECLPDAAVDLGSWGDDRPMLIQLVETREGLVGEFDRPDPAVAERLAKLYLHFGFGAEARQTLAAFAPDLRTAPLLTEIGTIFDQGHAAPGGLLGGMLDCDSNVALWAMLARDDLGPGDTVNEAAAFRAFSALPLHLRLMLGELLAERFLAIGAPDRARAVRDAILRAPGEHGLAVSMINARLELAEGDSRGAEPHLQDVAQANGPNAIAAVVLYIDGRLKDGLPVDRAMVENAGALAFAQRGTPEAPALERAQVLGLASNGDFAEAFGALARWRAGGLDPLQAQVKDELFAMLAAPEASGLFLTHYFANRDLIRPEEASADLRVALSERLLSFNFTDEARRMRGADAATTETGRLFLARAALADFDGAEALRQIDGFDGTEARRLRAEALRLLGRHDEAARAYLAAGAPEEAGSEAWRAGAWDEVAELDAGVRRDAVTAFGLVPGVDPVPLAPPPEPGPDGEAPGPLAQNRALIEESRAARDLIAALLADAGEIAPAE